MQFLEGIALVLLTLAGYSCGSVIAGRGKSNSVQLLDLGAATLLVILAFATSGAVGRWVNLPLWFALSCGAAALLASVRERKERIKTENRTGPIDETYPHRVLDGWKTFAAAMGNYQSRMLFAFFYFIIVMPFALGLRLFANPFKIKSEERNTSWLKRTSACSELKDAGEQF